MRRFLIKSPLYTGEADVLFDDTGRLVKIDVMGTDMPASIVHQFKQKVPAHVEGLTDAFAGSRATIVETSYEVTFDMWWMKYDKKINRKRSEPLWIKLSKADQVAAYYGVEPYDKFLKRDHWRPKADPEKYLKDKYWENEWK